MTRPARGLFRAIATFARFVTPSAHSSTSANPNSADRMKRNSLAVLASGLLSSTGASPRASMPTSPLLSRRNSLYASPNPSPMASPLELDDAHDRLASHAWQHSKPSRSESGGSGDQDVVSSPVAMTPIQSVPPSAAQSGHRVAFRSEPLREGSGPSCGPSQDTSLPGGQMSGDDAGPRFGFDAAEIDSKAKPGEAGHASIYQGSNVSLLNAPADFCCPDVGSHS